MKLTSVYVERGEITEHVVVNNVYDDHVLNIPSANFFGFNWCDYFEKLFPGLKFYFRLLKHAFNI